MAVGVAATHAKRDVLAFGALPAFVDAGAAGASDEEAAAPLAALLSRRWHAGDWLSAGLPSALTFDRINSIRCFLTLSAAAVGRRARCVYKEPALLFTRIKRQRTRVA